MDILKNMMPVENVADIRPLLGQIIDLMEHHFGCNCEILLHDFSQDYEHTIVDIRNGHITGRELGGCATNLGLEVMQGTMEPNNAYNYITYAPNGRMLRSSTMFFKNKEGKATGSLCINLDISETVFLEKFLRDYNNYEVDGEDAKDTPSEFFTQNVHEMLDTLIKQAQKLVGKSPKLLNKEEKMEFIAYLDSKGAFIITKSSERICSLLGISRYTFYNYLDAVRKSGKGQLVTTQSK